MLVLSGRIGDRIIINSGPYKVEIVIHRVRGNQVALAFDAPKEVSIDREKVFLAKEAAKGK